MTIAELNTKLNAELKSYLKKLKHFESGKLASSISFKCALTGDKLNIKLNSLEYINYLDNGELLANFLALPSTIEVINEFLNTSLFDVIYESLK